MKIKDKNKLTPVAKGDLLEDATLSLIKFLSDECGFGILELRRQGTGTQYGKDLKWRFSVPNESRTPTEYTWFIEDKNHQKTALGTSELSPKLVQVHKYSIRQALDVCCFLLPHVSVKNEIAEIFSDNGLYPFKITCWSPDQEIENLIMCYPELYKKIYGNEKKHTPEKRIQYIELWKQSVLTTSEDGHELMQLKNKPTVNTANSTAQSLDSTMTFNRDVQSKELLSHATVSSNTSISIAVDNVTKDKVGIEIQKAIKLLDSGKENEALEILFIVLGTLKSRYPHLTNELARTYNNIGVAYTQLKEDSKAIDYYHMALEVDSSFTIAITNIVATKLLIAETIKDITEREKLLSEIEALAKPLWVSPEYASNENVMHSYLKTLVAINGITAIEDLFLCTLSDSQQNTLKNSLKLNYLIASTYLGAWEFEKSKKYIDKSADIATDVEVSILQARYFMLIALKSDTLNLDMSYEDLTPTFTSYKNIDSALEIFNPALLRALEEGNAGQISYIKGLIDMCKLWRKDEDITPDKDYASEIQNKYVEAVTAFRQKQFSHSLALLKKSDEWGTLPPQEIFRLSRTYFFNGATEIARELQVSLESTDISKDFRYWIDRTLVEVLIGNKNNAMQFSTMAKELATSENDKRVALSHRGALYLRYADEEGGDRILQNAFEYEKEFPETQVLQKFNFEDEKEKILNMINERREWAFDVQEKYKSNPIPSYFLEKTFREPYITIWNSRDPNFPLDYTINTQEFIEELQLNYTKSTTFVFDYLALLTLSKLNLLYHIETYFQNAMIPFSLFTKIQEELLQKEDIHLRSLWNFIRNSSHIKLIKNIDLDDSLNTEMKKVFTPELIECFSLAKSNEAVLITDDFRIYRFSKSESITPLNTWYLLQILFQDRVLDKTMYSKALGLLAEVYYTFIGFDGDDLFQIIADDNYKLTPRVYHLINQATSPSAFPTSFTRTFVNFINRLWASGSLSEDKVYWLGYMTSINTQIFESALRAKAPDDITKVIAIDTACMWNAAISNGRNDDLLLITEKLDEILEGKILENIKDTIITKIKEKLKP